MASLDDDIARIAALRGRKASDYADPSKFVAKPQLRRDHVEHLFLPTGSPRDEMRALDRLPPASREFVRDCPHPLNTLAWEGLLANFPEADIIAAARSRTRWPSIALTPNPSLRRSRRRR